MNVSRQIVNENRRRVGRDQTRLIRNRTRSGAETRLIRNRTRSGTETRLIRNRARARTETRVRRCSAVVGFDHRANGDGLATVDTEKDKRKLF